MNTTIFNCDNCKIQFNNGHLIGGRLFCIACANKEYPELNLLEV